ncbi:pyridoxamine 5'-phosphate oxidase family protein [uncultured Pseudodesulfovibrio sp.]|uniref:pyridoxamine 5'-phosphate oxidase family protein n=1 Tax=uncultured Pseudodesulfovibrio sp. TaxID=2035858 RepID=UPI0029C88B3B|nr:pyridoxamine 5'-phosphate oxidase family protein [uncultured Pseudodesulfovibrio sp.]
MSKQKIKLIEDIIKAKDICVLATSDGIAPHTSLMHYFADHAVMKFYFLTSSTSKKSKNLKKNPHVSLLIDRRDENIALSIEGIYSPIKKQQTVEAIVKLFLLKNPHMKEFAMHPETELVRIEGKSAELVQGFTDVFFTKLKNY